ncbi:hypothetical protein [Hyphomicrobium sp.]|uniref:hypothetical protein n=1 Tax=Hyphomicrobium sp. TaxID=82 RepID=UPI002FE35738
MSPAPPIAASRRFNTDEPLTLDALRGRVVVIEAFQRLCPGCVSHRLPQAGRVFETFSRDDVAVLGLHCVFEHHDAQTPTSLEAFLHEYRNTASDARSERRKYRGRLLYVLSGSTLRYGPGVVEQNKAAEEA